MRGPMAEFDAYARDYEAILNHGVGIAGSGSEYFYEQKAWYISRLLSPTPASYAGKLLDYGCGIGLLSGALREALPAARLHGFDVSPESVARVPRPLKSAGTYTVDPAELDDDYDLILLVNVLHHVDPAQRQPLVDDLAQRLTPGGRLLILEHNRLNPLTRWVVWRCPLDEHAVLLGRREARRHLQRAGLTPDREDYILFFPPALRRLRPLEAWLSRLPLGAQFAVAFRRADA